jgi:hypothetical protein
VCAFGGGQFELTWVQITEIPLHFTSQSYAYIQEWFQKSTHNSRVPCKTTVKTVMLIDCCYHLDSWTSQSLYIYSSIPLQLEQSSEINEDCHEF